MQQYDPITRQFREKESNSGLIIEGLITLAITGLIGTAYCSYASRNSVKEARVTHTSIEEIVDDEGLVTGTRTRINITGYERCLFLSEQQEYDLNVGDKLEFVRWELTPTEKCDQVTELKKYTCGTK